MPGIVHSMIQGRLRDYPIADLLGLIAGGQKSGVLTVRLDEREARIHFELGKVLYARVEDGANLGEYLVRFELMNPEEIQSLIARQHKENPHTPLGMMAVRSGNISEDDLKRALEAQCLDATTEVLIWNDNQRSRFDFKERGPDASQVPTQHIFDAMGLLLEATRRLDEWRRGQVKPYDVFEVALETSGPPPTLTVGEWELLHLVDGQRSAASIAAELDIPEGETYRRLFLLLERNLLRRADVRPEDPWVLIVTESHTTRRLNTMTLTRERYRVMHADTLEKAKELLEERRPNTVLLDWSNALEAAKLLRGAKGKNLTPIIAIVKEEPRKGGLFNRAATVSNLRYLLKPYSEMQLLASVSAVTGRAI
jgi:CheY-like chemotaxis protein